MILKLIFCIPMVLNLWLFWSNRKKSNRDLKNLFMAIQFVVAVCTFFTSGIWAGLGALFGVLLIKICPAFLVRILWILSCIGSVLTIIGVLGVIK